MFVFTKKLKGTCETRQTPAENKLQAQCADLLLYHVLLAIFVKRHVMYSSLVRGTGDMAPLKISHHLQRTSALPPP